MTGPDDPSDDDALAAEYVLHLLDADARRAFEARLRSEPALRDRVHRWEADLAGLAAEVGETAPPRAVKSAVLAAVAGPAASRGPSRIWAYLVGGLAVAGLAALALFNLGGLEDAQRDPRLEVELATEDRSLVLLAAVARETGELVVEPQVGAPPPGRVLELWLIAEGADAPVSLGVLETGAPTRLDLPDDVAAALPEGTLAISDEPPGGSPTGAPTGTVLATATVAAG